MTKQLENKLQLLLTHIDKVSYSTVAFLSDNIEELKKVRFEVGDLINKEIKK